MIVEHVPSVAALESDQQDRLAAELPLASLRARRQELQSLTKFVERLGRAGDPDGIGAQLAEEMAPLGCHLLEGAAALCGQRSDESGVFACVPGQGTPPRRTS